MEQQLEQEHVTQQRTVEAPNSGLRGPTTAAGGDEQDPIPTSPEATGACNINHIALRSDKRSMVLVHSPYIYFRLLHGIKIR